MEHPSVGLASLTQLLPVSSAVHYMNAREI